MQEEWGNRVQLDHPWQHPSNVMISQELKELKNNSVDLKNNALEREVATDLGNSNIVAVNYKWQSVRKCMPGDVDCLVNGFMMKDGIETEQVVVLGEIKHMQSKYTEAASQIRKNYQRWCELCLLLLSTPAEPQATAMAEDCT